MIQHDLHSQERLDQIALEEQSDTKAFEELLSKRNDDLKTRGDEDVIVSAFITRAHSTVQGLLEEILASNSNSQYQVIVSSLSSELVTGLTLTHTFRTLLESPKTFQYLSSCIGKAIVTEVIATQVQAISPLYCKRVEEGLEKKAVRSLKHIDGVYRKALDTVSEGTIQHTLTSSDYIHIGKFCVDALHEAGVIEMHRRYVKEKDLITYHLSKEIEDFIRDPKHCDMFAKIGTLTRYCITKPDDWTSMYGGGYFSKYRKKLVGLMILKHTMSREVRREILKEFNAENFPKVFETANFIQSIPFTVNEKVLELAKDIWIKDMGIFGLPKRAFPEHSEFPFHDSWKKEEATEEELKQFSAWCAGKADWYTFKQQHQSKVYGTYQALFQAPVGVPLYFVVQCDTRNRWYYNASINPQGDDLHKALLQFYNKKPLGKRGLYWLKVHLANSLGVDDIRFDKRVEYIDANWEQLCRALDNPYDLHDVFGSDAPLQAYITALEIREAIESGSPETYESGIAVHMDATVSGTQHFSAMLRDPIGALFTNLEDNGTDKKSDLYTHVANEVLKRVAEDSESEYSKFWLEHGVSRTMAKRPVMTFNYAVTKLTVSDYVRLVYKEETGNDIDNRTAFYLADKIFEGVAKAIPATYQGMEFLKGCSREVGTDVITWTTPIGFKVYQDRPNVKKKRLRVRSAGVNVVIAKEAVEGCNKSKMVSSIAPNFIHSYDSAHLSLTALEMKARGLQGAYIHDSIGTHACDVDELQSIVRETFIGMYKDRNVMQELKESLGLELEAPEQGDFDLDLVRDSEFFFS